MTASLLTCHYRLKCENLQLSYKRTGDIVGNHLARGPGFGALLLLFPALAFVVSLLWSIVPAPAQTQTYTYTGPAFDIATCQALYGTTSYPQCIGGSITGTLTTTGTSASSWAMNAGAAGSLS